MSVTRRVLAVYTNTRTGFLRECYAKGGFVRHKAEDDEKLDAIFLGCAEKQTAGADSQH
jgi:hypothetical protein